MRAKDKGIIFRQNLLDIPGLTRDQRIAILKMVCKETRDHIDIIKEAISDDNIFKILSSGVQTKDDEKKCQNEIQKLADKYSNNEANILLDFFSAFDPIYEIEKERFLDLRYEITSSISNYKEQSLNKAEGEVSDVEKELRSFFADIKLMAKELIGFSMKSISQLKANINWNVKIEKLLAEEFGAFFGFLGTIVMVIAYVWLFKIVKLNLDSTFTNPNALTLRLLGPLSWSVPLLILASACYFIYLLICNLEPNRDKSYSGEMKFDQLSPYQKRRLSCSPLLIGLIIGLVAPFLSLVYAIRQRSWLLILSTFWIIFAANMFLLPPVNPQPFLIKKSYQIICGATVYLIARKQKLETRALCKSS